MVDHAITWPSDVAFHVRVFHTKRQETHATGCTTGQAVFSIDCRPHPAPKGPDVMIHTLSSRRWVILSPWNECMNELNFQLVQYGESETVSMFSSKVTRLPAMQC